MSATGTIGLATNNTAFQVKDTGGTLRTAFLMNASDVFTIGTTNNVVRVNSYDLELNAQTGRTVAAMVNGSTIGSFSSTGLAVTGALSSTTASNLCSTSGTLTVGSNTATAGGINVNTSGTTGNMPYVNFKAAGTQYGLVALTGALLGTTATDMCIFAETGKSINLWPNGGTTGVIINTSGNVGIGTSSPAQRLHVNSSSASVSPITTTSVTGDTAYQAILVTKFDNDSTTSQNFIQFQINNGGANCGRITANGANTAAFGSTSDKRVKENIAELPSQLANIMALRPVEFDYLESYGGGHQIGFVAQEIQQVYPDVISTDDSSEKIMSITGWSKTEARLVKALQELNANLVAELQSLRARVATLESK